MPAAVFRELGHPGSRSPFDRPICISRELAFTHAPLSELRTIGASRPIRATVNDVLLAIVAGGLRTWLGVDRGMAPNLRAQVPVSLHHRDERPDELGNRDSFLNVDLPIAETDPLVRLDRIRVETSTRKRLDDAEELYDLFHAIGRVNHLARVAQRLAGSAREFSLSISNVPGPRTNGQRRRATRRAPVLLLRAGRPPCPSHLGGLVRGGDGDRDVHRPGRAAGCRSAGRCDRRFVRGVAERGNPMTRMA